MDVKAFCSELLSALAVADKHSQQKCVQRRGMR